MGTAADVTVISNGSIWFAPLGTDLPTAADDTLDAAFDDLGFVDENGLSQTLGNETTDIKEGLGGATVRTVSTSSTVTYALSFLETNEGVMTAYYGNYDAGEVKVRGTAGTRGVWVFDVLDGDRHLRLVISDGEITSRGDTAYKNGEAVVYPVTISAYPDENGDNATIFVEDAA